MFLSLKLPPVYNEENNFYTYCKAACEDLPKESKHTFQLVCFSTIHDLIFLQLLKVQVLK